MRTNKIVAPILHYKQPAAVWVVLACSIFLLAGCGKQEMSGRIQSSQMTNDGYQLSFVSSGASDYVLIQTKALVGEEIAGALESRNDTNSLLRLGTQYTGRDIRVAGRIQQDEMGRRFILVTNRNQITLLR